jgi:hypothetical protein
MPRALGTERRRQRESMSEASCLISLRASNLILWV